MIFIRSVALASVLAFPAAAMQEEGVRWRTSLDDAFEAAQASGKPVLALFWAEW